MKLIATVDPMFWRPSFGKIIRNSRFTVCHSKQLECPMEIVKNNSQETVISMGQKKVVNALIKTLLDTQTRNTCTIGPIDIYLSHVTKTFRGHENRFCGQCC